MKCATTNCDRYPRSSEFRWCDACTAVVLRTGRPPVLPAKFVPAWLKRLTAKETTWAA